MAEEVMNFFSSNGTKLLYSAQSKAPAKKPKPISTVRGILRRLFGVENGLKGIGSPSKNGFGLA